MNTKLNMGVIEDKSITYSKLADDVAESITATMTGSAPDWNASEGEAGYIENKPFGLYNKCECTLGNGVNITEVSSMAKFIYFNDRIIELPQFKDGMEFSIVSGPPVSIKYSYSYNGHAQLELIDPTNYFSETTIEFYSNIKLINSSYIPNPVVDWNAQEEEAGYIENKPYEKINSAIEKYDDDTLLFWTADNDADNMSLEYEIINHYIKIGDILQKLDNEDYEIINNKDVYNITYNKGRYYLSSNRYNADDMLSMINDGQLSIFFIVDGINAIYLTDNVVKTIPQELSNTNKNQALTNLGIDPVVWKYICDPLIIKSGQKVPEELIGEYNEVDDEYWLKYPHKAMYKIAIRRYIEEDGYGNADILIDCNEINASGVKALSLIIDDSPYDIYMYIDKDKKWAEA